MRTFFVCLLSLAPSIALAAEATLTGPKPEPVAVSSVPSFDLGTVSARESRADANATNAISRDEICNTLTEAAQAHDLPVAFFTSLIWQESGFKPTAVSPVGAQGVAQFMPRVAEAMGLDDPFDPRQALPTSARLLRTLFNQFGNLGLAAAAYNAGPRLVLNWLDRKKNAKLPKETRDYVLAITGRQADQWRGAMASAEFRAPSRTQCHITASRVHREDGELRVVDMAPGIPLPRNRPSDAELTAPAANTLVAEASTAKPVRTKTVTIVRAMPASPPKNSGITTVRMTVPAPKTKVLAARKQPLKLFDVAQAGSAKAKAARTAKIVAPKAAKRVRVAKAD